MYFEFFMIKLLPINFDVMHDWFPGFFNKCAAYIFQLRGSMTCYFRYKLLDQESNCSDC